ncbi:568_t:CDS:1, partial [Cetraspora pellucida]
IFIFGKWLENTIREGHIELYGYSKVFVFKQIGEGGFGTVYGSE